jgi:hypothetical protein
MAWSIVFWFLMSWDNLSQNDKTQENWRTFRFGNIVYVIQRRSNNCGNFMEFSEYGEDGRRSFIIIPEGDEGKGWKECRMQILRLKQHYEKQQSKGTQAGKAPISAYAGNISKGGARNPWKGVLCEYGGG